jgi:hypothetical protein
MTKPIRLAILLVVLCTVAFAQSTDVNLLLSTLPAGKDPPRYKGYVEPQFKAITQRALYLKMRDGVKIAVTVVLPRDLPADQKIPAILAELKFGLHSISVLVKKGHRLLLRLRVTIRILSFVFPRRARRRSQCNETFPGFR